MNVSTSTPNLAGAVNSTGYYTLSVPAGLAAGANSLKLVYSGDANYNAVSSSLTVTGVSLLSTSLGLSYSTLLSMGQPFTLSAIINGTVQSGVTRTGTLSLLQGSTTLASINLATTSPGSNGYYALTVPAGLPIGVSNLTAAYSGDSNYAASTAALAPVTVRTISTNISLSYGNVLAGQPFTR